MTGDLELSDADFERLIAALESISANAAEAMSILTEESGGAAPVTTTDTVVQHGVTVERI